MKVYHQTGFRYNWNIESFNKGIGDGLIFSPVNIHSDKIIEMDLKMKSRSFIDPQLYLLNEPKGDISTYPFFPGNLTDAFTTSDLDNFNKILAKECIDYQIQNGFDYLVIPNRYYEDNPTNYYLQSTDFFVQPFCNYINEIKSNKKILLSVIVKKIMLIDEIKRDELLNWITSHQNISGVYIIFENEFSTKQIKDFDYLLNVLNIIRILKSNDLEVHVGYTNTESIVYSLAMPDSITMGSYENLRSFGIRRFQDTESTPMRSPNARLYSAKLLQWIDYQYIEAMKKLVDNYQSYFEDSEYKPLMFKSEFKWHFAKSEPYKHYFKVFYEQINGLPKEQLNRIQFVKKILKEARESFSNIEDKILLDSNSDGSHIATWFNVINAFEKEL